LVKKGFTRKKDSGSGARKMRRKKDTRREINKQRKKKKFGSGDTNTENGRSKCCRQIWLLRTEKSQGGK